VFCLTLDRKRHWLPSEPTELDRYLKREFPDLDLFAYWHRHTRLWTVALWLSRDKGRAVEILALGGFPLLSREQAVELRRRLYHPQTTCEMKALSKLAEDQRRDKWEARSRAIHTEMARIRRDLHPGQGSQPRVSFYVPRKEILVV